MLRKSLFYSFRAFAFCFSLILVSCGSEAAVRTLQAQVTPETLTNACTSEDKQLYIHRENTAFSHSLRSCANDTWGDAEETAQCLRKTHQQLSYPCAKCFGNTAACTKDKCFWTCAFSPRGAGCRNCSLEQCGDELENCTGVPRNHLPKDEGE